MFVLFSLLLPSVFILLLFFIFLFVSFVFNCLILFWDSFVCLVVLLPFYLSFRPLSVFFLLLVFVFFFGCTTRLVES